MIVLGLTGSIGMGKTQAAKAVAEMGCPVFEADAAVHRLLANDAGTVAEVAAAFPQCATAGAAAIDRACLGNAVFGDGPALNRLEAILHPRVRAAAGKFLALAEAEAKPLAVLEMPLLFETGANEDCDAVAVVTASEAVQSRRVLARPGMTPSRLAFVLSRQMPDAEKRRKADYLVDTGSQIHQMLPQLEEIVRILIPPATANS